MKTALSLAKHAVASAAVVVAAAAVTTLLYFVLFFWAAFTGGGLGSPLTLPLMVLIAVVFVVASIVFILLPVTGAAEVICARFQRTTRFAQIPVATGLLLVYLSVVITISTALLNGNPKQVVLPALVLTAIELLLLGLYWWCIQAADLLMLLSVKLFRIVRARLATRRVAAV